MASDTRLRTLPKRTLLSGEEEARLESEDRRAFLRRSAAIAGGALAAGSVASTARGAPLAVPAVGAGDGTADRAGDVRHALEVRGARRAPAHRRLREPPELVRLEHDAAAAPARHHHARTASSSSATTPARRTSIRATHQLVIHGMVRQPLVFTMDDLMRYPAVSRFHFLECSGNGLTDWLKNASTTVQQTHGLLSGAQWTGIPVSWLLDEAGVQPRGKWLLFEGADGSSHTRSVPLDKALDDVPARLRVERRDAAPRERLPAARLRPRLGGQRRRSSGCGASRSATSRGTSAARRRATPTRCRTASGASSASSWSASR